MSSNVLSEIERRIRGIEEELGISGAITFARGRPTCEECLRIEVDAIDDFIKIVAAMVRQGIAMGTLPILILERVTSTSVAVYAVDMCNQVIASLELELRY